MLGRAGIVKTFVQRLPVLVQPELFGILYCHNIIFVFFSIQKRLSIISGKEKKDATEISTSEVLDAKNSVLASLTSNVINPVSDGDNVLLGDDLSTIEVLTIPWPSTCEGCVPTNSRGIMEMYGGRRLLLGQNSGHQENSGFIFVILDSFTYNPLSYP